MQIPVLHHYSMLLMIQQNNIQPLELLPDDTDILYLLRIPNQLQLHNYLYDIPNKH